MLGIRKKFALVSFLMPLSSFACNVNDLNISNEWLRPTAEGQRSSALYMDIKNNCDSDQYLVSVQSEITNNIQLHKSVDENGVVKMYHIDKVVIPAGKVVNLKPKSLHVMVMDLSKKLDLGEKVQFLLKFENLGDKIIEVEVKQK